MRIFDLHDGSAKLQRALRDLKEADLRISEQWDDAVHREIRETYIAPLETMMRRTLGAIDKMAEVLTEAERDCGE